MTRSRSVLFLCMLCLIVSENKLKLMLHNIGWNLWDIDADVAHHVIDALEARAHLINRDDKAVGKRRIRKVGKETKKKNFIWSVVMTKLLESGGLEEMCRRRKGKTLLLNLLMRPSEETGQQLAHGLFGFLMNTFNDHVDGLKHQLMVEVRHL